VLPRLAYLGVTNAFALLRLLPMSDRDKDAEILALRHQLTVLQRQLGSDRVRFTPSDRALLAALLHRLPRHVLKRMHLVVRPDTVLRWHRDLLARQHARRCRPKRAGRPRTVHSIRALVLRLARENPGWGYRRVHGELLVLGVKVAASTVGEILKDAGIDPAPERGATTWADFLRSQADALLACDFFETTTLSGARLYVLAAIEHATRRIRILGATAHPTASWVAQAARNLVMDLQDAGTRARFLIRDRDGKYPDLFDAILTDAGIEVVLSGVRMPRMNAVMERWVQTCRHELLDRTLIWNQTHLLQYTPYASSSTSTTSTGRTRASPTPDRYTRCPRPSPITTRSSTSTSEDATASAAPCTNTNTPPDLRGRGFRQGQSARFAPIPGWRRSFGAVPAAARAAVEMSIKLLRPGYRVEGRARRGAGRVG
jgi:putative transposase